MHEDIKIKCESGAFKYRVCGIVIVDQKLLVQRICDNDFYCLPGGHVELGEATTEAVLREMREETELEYDIKSLICINENFFLHKQKLCHELGFYYMLEPKNKDFKPINYSRIELDKGKEVKLTFEWINLEELGKIDFRPSFLKEKIRNKDFKVEHVITKEI